MIRLDDLEAKAKAAESWDWYGTANLEDDLGQVNASFIASMSPATTLALIRVARAAIRHEATHVEGCPVYNTNRKCDCGYAELEEALKEIDE